MHVLAARRHHPRAVHLAGTGIGVVAHILGAAVSLDLVCRDTARRHARHEVRGTGELRVGEEVAVSVDDDVARPLLRHAVREAPREGLGGEGEAARELQLARGLAPGLHGDEGQAHVDRERRDEGAAVLLGAMDRHRGRALRAAEGDVGVEGAAGGPDRGDAHQRQGAELDPGGGGAPGVEGSVVEPLDDRVGVRELARGLGGERQALEGDPAGERFGALAEEAGGDGALGEVVGGPAVGRGHEDVDAAPDREIGGQRGEAEQERAHERCQDGSVPHVISFPERRSVRPAPTGWRA